MLRDPQNLFFMLLIAISGKMGHPFTITTSVPALSLRLRSPSSILFSSNVSNNNNNVDGSGNNMLVGPSQLGELLKELDVMDASEEEIKALFDLLDNDGDGKISMEKDFQPWYATVLGEGDGDGVGKDNKSLSSSSFQEVLMDRRTIHDYDDMVMVDDGVLHRAIQCAIAAPNHKMTEPWRFVKIGFETVQKIAALNAAGITNEAKAQAKRERWAKIPGWCVVTSKRYQEDALLQQEDYAATCCAVQNFMLSMWSEGVGTKWTSGDVTRTKAFAELCQIDYEQEYVVGCIWYGFAKNKVTPKKLVRKRSLNDVLSEVP